MKMFGWVQNKFNALQGNDRRSNAVSVNHHAKLERAKEEFSDWPHALLAIGTFGNNAQNQNLEIQVIQEEVPSSPEELLDFTPEEVGKLEKELTRLLKRKPAGTAELKEKNADLPLDKFLNCPSSLEVDRRICDSFRSNSDEANSDENVEQTISVILDRYKSVCAENRKKSIGKKSIFFLLKKFFPCPSLRDTLWESRMEKILRKMLHKMMYPKHPSWSSSMKKYLGGKQVPKTGAEEETMEKVNDGCKWVKTDSEYIVLEI